MPGAGAAGVQEGGARAADGAAVPRGVPGDGVCGRVREHVGAAGACAPRAAPAPGPPGPPGPAGPARLVPRHLHTHSAALPVISTER